MNYCWNCNTMQAGPENFCRACGSRELVEGGYLWEFQREWKKSVEAAEWIYSLPSGVK